LVLAVDKLPRLASLKVGAGFLKQFRSDRCRPLDGELALICWVAAGSRGGSPAATFANQVGDAR
jgi:hypothetical protein